MLRILVEGTVHIGLVIVGVNHCSAPAHLIERVRECDQRLREAVAQLRNNQTITGAIYAALPSRTEIIVATWDAVTGATLIFDVLNGVLRLHTEDWSSFYRHIDEVAVAHLLSAGESDSGQATNQLEFCWEQAQRSGTADRVLSQLVLELRGYATARPDESDAANRLRATAWSIWGKLQAEACLPVWAKFHHEIGNICAQEIAAFRRSCGGLMTDDQEKAVKIVTARISERVGEWITRAWNEPGTRGAHGIRDNS